MRPTNKDIQVKVKISGIQLEELQKHTWEMSEAFGLDMRIDNYKGTRPISFYSWDLECILEVLSMTLDNRKEYPDKTAEGFKELNNLYHNLKALYLTTYEK